MWVKVMILCLQQTARLAFLLKKTRTDNVLRYEGKQLLVFISSFYYLRKPQ